MAAVDNNPAVSVVIPVMNEERTLAAVIEECRHVHPDAEVIVVLNGSSDRSRSIAYGAGVRVVEIPVPLGHDVGRSIGARHARGEIIVFTDGDIVVKRADLQRLVQAVQQGVDVALNRYLGPIRKKKIHRVVLAKHALNMFVSKPQLRGASMTTIPHAISRRALESIGDENLAVPPKAQAMAIFKGLKVEAVHFIDVGKRNANRGRSKSDPLGRLIFGDHLEALKWMLEQTDKRGNRTDLTRKREVIR